MRIFAPSIYRGWWRGGPMPRVNRSHPLFRSLQALFVFRGGMCIELLSGVTSKSGVGTVPVYGVGALGEGVYGSGGGIAISSASNNWCPASYSHVGVFQVASKNGGFSAIFTTSNVAVTAVNASLQNSGGTNMTCYTSASDSGPTLWGEGAFYTGQPMTVAVNCDGSTARNFVQNGQTLFAPISGTQAPSAISDGRMVFLAERSGGTNWVTGYYYLHAVFSPMLPTEAQNWITRPGEAWSLLSP